MESRFENIAFLHGSYNEVSIAIDILAEQFSQKDQNRKFDPIPLVTPNKKRPNIEQFIDKLKANQTLYNLVLIDYIQDYDKNNESSLYSLLDYFIDNKINIPWIVLNSPKKEVVEEDLKKVRDRKIDEGKLKINRDNILFIFHNSLEQQEETLFRGYDFEYLKDGLLKKIWKLEEDVFLRSVISGKDYIKTCLIPGFKKSHDNAIHYHLPFNNAHYENNISPDYYLIGGDYFTNNSQKEINKLPQMLISKNNHPGFVYSKSFSDTNLAFKSLSSHPSFYIPPYNSKEHILIHPNEDMNGEFSPYVVIDKKLKLSILNICFHGERTELLINKIRFDKIKLLLNHLDKNSDDYISSIKIVNCHYDLFNINNHKDNYSSQLENILISSGFAMLIHDHNHEVARIKPENFIHSNNKGLLRISCGFFDKKPNNLSSIKQFFSTLHFIYNNEILTNIGSFKLKVWILNGKDFNHVQERTNEFNRFIKKYSNINVMENIDYENAKNFFEFIKTVYPMAKDTVSFLVDNFNSVFQKKGITSEITEDSIEKNINDGLISFDDLVSLIKTDLLTQSTENKALSIYSLLDFANSNSTMFKLNDIERDQVREQMKGLRLAIDKFMGFEGEKNKIALQDAIKVVEVERSIYNKLLKIKNENETSSN